MSAFTARYHSTCGHCGEPISPGDSAQWVDDEVIHAICNDDQPDRPVVVCTDCWMTKPCFCEDE
jgi:hypothetical protein